MSKGGSRLGRLGVLAPAALSACVDASVMAAPAAGAILSTVLKELSKAFMLKNWFHGAMSAQEAEQLLLQKGKHGSYLVRESSRPGDFVLSVRVRTRVAHVIIRREQNKYHVGSGESFDDLSGLIEHCRAYPLTEASGEVLRLRQPVSAARARTRHLADKPPSKKRIEHAVQQAVFVGDSLSLSEQDVPLPSPEEAELLLLSGPLIFSGTTEPQPIPEQAGSLPVSEPTTPLHIPGPAASLPICEQVAPLPLPGPAASLPICEQAPPLPLPGLAVSLPICEQPAPLPLQGQAIPLPYPGQTTPLPLARQASVTCSGQAASVSFRRQSGLVATPRPSLPYCAKPTPLVLPTEPSANDRYAIKFSKIKVGDNIYNFTTHIGSADYNVYKNRYHNILPYDQTRVILPWRVCSGDSTLDYINASYIRPLRMFESVVKGLMKNNMTPEPVHKHDTKEKFYIATQGPMTNTRRAFWDMVVDNDVRVIAMVTHCIERSKVKSFSRKCDVYWPSSGKTEVYEGVRVKNIREQSYPHFLVRELEVIALNRRRTVYQYQYLLWPDRSTPDDGAHGVLSYLRDINHRMNALSRAKDAPDLNILCVHCSAGVGRTGTLIALDMLIELAKMKKLSKEAVEQAIPGIVRLLRCQRPGMVQTSDQYHFIYEVLGQYMTALNSGSPGFCY